MDEKYGRKPVPAEKYVRAMLDQALSFAEESLATSEVERSDARRMAAKADEMHLLWLGRISYVKAAIATLEAIPEVAPPPAPPSDLIDDTPPWEQEPPHPEAACAGPPTPRPSHEHPEDFI